MQSNDFVVMESGQDASVNFVTPAPQGFFEARYVRRVSSYFSLYLSSQSGCNQGCRMCHLTASRQTKLVHAMPYVFFDQARRVYTHYHTQPQAEMVHYNFMARGEALDNPFFAAPNGSQHILGELGRMATERNLVPRFLISTIIPRTMEGRPLAKMFPVISPEIYYSIYSVRKEFRAKWLPKAMDVDYALHMLCEYQLAKRIMPKLHWAFIEGENDSYEDVQHLCAKVKAFGLQNNFAVVRYNPYGEAWGRESSEEVIDRNIGIMQEWFPNSRIKKITRVGMDVKASCGMFVTGNEIAVAQ